MVDPGNQDIVYTRQPGFQDPNFEPIPIVRQRPSHLSIFYLSFVPMITVCSGLMKWCCTFCDCDEDNEFVDMEDINEG